MTVRCVPDDFNYGRWGISRSDDHRTDWTWPLLSRARAELGERSVSPSRTYSKRSKKLHQLRIDSAALARADFEDSVAVTALALAGAEDFINGLWEGCLDFELQLSHDGEINFLYGDSIDLFHIHIDEEGKLSYYSLKGGDEQMGSQLNAPDFPYKNLLDFVDRNR